MKKIILAFLLTFALIPQSYAASVSSISVPVGGSVHVTVTQRGNPLNPSTITWSAQTVATIVPDTTGFNFSGSTVGTVTVVATHPSDGATGNLAVIVTPSSTLSPDGSVISGGIGSLITVDGTWTFGAAVGGRPGDWELNLNGNLIGIGSKLQVANGGHIYAFTNFGGDQWFIRQNNMWVPTSAPSMTLPLAFTSP